MTLIAGKLPIVGLLDMLGGVNPSPNLGFRVTVLPPECYPKNLHHERTGAAFKPPLPGLQNL